MKEMNPEDEQVQLQVRKLQDYITDHFYTCSDKILSGLGRMYAGGGELTENIEDVGGVGTAEFVSKAIDIRPHTRYNIDNLIRKQCYHYCYKLNGSHIYEKSLERNS